jgi:hypothetical protein
MGFAEALSGVHFVVVPSRLVKARTLPPSVPGVVTETRIPVFAVAPTGK